MTARWARWVLLVAGLVTVLSFAAADRLIADLSTGGFDDPGSESSRLYREFERVTGVNPTHTVVALVRPGGTVTSGPGRAAVQGVAARMAADPAVALVITPFESLGVGQVSRDGTAAYVVGRFPPNDGGDRGAAAERLQAAFADDPAVLLGGSAVAARAVTETIESDLRRAELVALPAVLLLSLWVFRGVVAALLMPAMGAVAISLSLVGLGLAAQLTTVSTFAVNLVAALGLGLAVDYSLLMITRHREELARHGDVSVAVRATLATAGRSVVFSSITVAAAMAGLMLFPVSFLFSVGLGGLLSALLAGFVALVVLPAALILLGPRVNAGAPARWQRHAEVVDPGATGVWYRVSRLVMRRPGMVAVVVAAVLLTLAAPALQVRFTPLDIGVLPPSSPARQLIDVVARDFPRDAGDAVIVGVSAGGSPAERAAVTALTRRIDALPRAADVSEALHLGGRLWAFRVLPRGEVLDDGTRRLVADIRAESGPGEVLVGGPTATFLDQQAAIRAGLPAAAGVIVLVTLVALFLMTGSVVLPVKAVILNVLSLAATLGILVWVFQEGHLQTLLGFESRGAIGLTQPVLLGAVAFGLSTDYAVFLLSRIKELRDDGLSNQEAVAAGLQRTGRVVSAAALLFAVAVGAFALSQIVILKEIGVGAAVAVLLDASIVRVLLVPGLMGVMGEWNWWAPGPLRRMHLRLRGVSG